MASRNYIIGRRFEYRVMDYLRSKGYYCIRSYGSKGTFDVIAIPRISGSWPRIDGFDNDWYELPLLIQAKSAKYIPKKERERLIDANKWNGLVIKAWKKKDRSIVFETFPEGIIIPL